MGDFINTTENAISIRRDAPAARLYRLFISFPSFCLGTLWHHHASAWWWTEAL